MVECVCKECEKTFSVSPSKIKQGRAKYCSLECYKTPHCRRCKTNKVELGLRLCTKCLSVRKCTYCHQDLDKSEFEGNNARCKQCTIELDKISCRICLSRFHRHELDEHRYCTTCATQKKEAKQRKCKCCHLFIDIKNFSNRKRYCDSCFEKIRITNEAYLEKRKKTLVQNLIKLLKRKITQYRFCNQCNQYLLKKDNVFKNDICFECYYKDVPKSEKVECKICGESFHSLFSHLHRRHNMTRQAYIDKYGEQKMFSIFYGNIFRNINKVRPDEYKKTLSIKARLFWKQHKRKHSAKLRIAQNTLQAKHNHKIGFDSWFTSLTTAQRDVLSQKQKDVWKDDVKRANRIKGINNENSIRIRRLTGLKNVKYLLNHRPGKITSINLKISKELENLSIKHELEHIVGRYSIDVALPDIKLAIECDGDFWHGNPNIYSVFSSIQIKKKTKDIEKNHYLISNGWEVLRFWETDINKNLKYCIDKILEVIKDKSKCYGVILND